MGRLADRRGELVRLLPPPLPLLRSYTNNRLGLEFCFFAGHAAAVAAAVIGDCGERTGAPEEHVPRTGALSVPRGNFGNTDCARRAQALFDSRCRFTSVCRYGRLLVDDDDDGAGDEADVPEPAAAAAAAAAAVDFRSRLLWNEFHRRMGSRKYCLDFRDAGRDSSGLDSFFKMPFLHFDDLRRSAAAGNRSCRR